MQWFCDNTFFHNFNFNTSFVNFRESRAKELMSEHQFVLNEQICKIGENKEMFHKTSSLYFSLVCNDASGA